MIISTFVYFNHSRLVFHYVRTTVLRSQNYLLGWLLWWVQYDVSADLLCQLGWRLSLINIS